MPLLKVDRFAHCNEAVDSRLKSNIPDLIRMEIEKACSHVN